MIWARVSMSIESCSRVVINKIDELQKEVYLFNALCRRDYNKLKGQKNLQNIFEDESDSEVQNKDVEIKVNEEDEFDVFRNYKFLDDILRKEIANIINSTQI